jgi:hypothetical protein
MFSRSILFGALATVALVAACESSHDDAPKCDEVRTHCATVCDTWCDSWGCYPDCYDRCWDECVVYTGSPPGPVPVLPPDDAGKPPVEAGTDASHEAGAGSTCDPCSSNDDCVAGALCVVRGGEAGAGGFCATACAQNADCGQGNTCATIGGSKHCLCQ